MKAIKKIALKGILLLVGLIILNFIYKATLWENDLEQYSGIVDELNTTQTADILYLGDCSDSYFGPDNDNEKGIGQLLDSLLPSKKVTSISETGFQAEMFAAVLNNIPKNTPIKTVIVTMNLRSFAARILHTIQNNSINQRLVMLNSDFPPLLNRFLLTTKKTQHYSGAEIEKMRIAQWKNDKINNAPYNTLYDWKMAYENDTSIKFNTTHQKEKGAAHIANYAFQINIKTNPRIQDFDNIVAIAKKRNWKLVFHLLPENINTSNQLIGKDFTKLILYNRELLKQHYHKNGVIIIDNLELLDSIEFIEDMPNSHYQYNGRRLMAERIKEELITFKK